MPTTKPKWTDRLRKFSATVEQAKAEAAEKAAAAEAKEAEAHELQKRYEQLNKEVDKAADQLILADAQIANFKSAVLQMREAMLDGFGKSHADGSALPAPHYGDLVALEAAITDFPRIRQHLATKAEAAQRALKDFEHEHL